MRFAMSGLLLLGVATLASAHHSGAMFDQAKTVTLVGTIKEYQFSNPHVWIEIMVPGRQGKPVQWSIEGEAPQLMARLGLKPRTLPAGEKVTIRAHPLRDGRSGGSFITLTLSDGKVIGRGPAGGAAPAAAPAPATNAAAAQR
jgi:hypothetical protein